jgi:uncharacterized membrane protein YeaQ/YmgE (transglycosylase-associated protein family)
MGLIAWIVLGAIAGFLGNYVMKGGFGLAASLIAGMVAAVIAGLVTNAATGKTDIFALDLVNVVLATFFAIIVVGVAKVALGRGSGD